MDISTIILYAIAACILGAGILAVTSTKIFRAAIYLLFSLVSIAALYFWMQVEFIAAIQIVVYVGGIVVLIIFSIFLTQQSGKEMAKPSVGKILSSLGAALFGFLFTANIITHYSWGENPGKIFTVTVDQIGREMLSTTEHGYILPFEVISMLLLAAMIGCIVIALKRTEKTLDI
jgi:NADH-quinone oxidoreductase subunit J